MSNNENSKRENDKFFPSRTDDKPRAPGAFTRSFMGTDAPGPASPLDSNTPASPAPFTAQFGSVNSFGSAPESWPGSIPERVSGDSQQPASAGSLTTMFGSNASAQKQSSEPQTEVTRVLDHLVTNSQAPKNTNPSGFTQMFGSVQAAPETREPSAAASPFEGKTLDSTDFFKSPTPAAPSTPTAEAPLSPLSAQPGTGRFTELFKNESTSSTPKPAPAPTPFSSSGPSGFTELFKTSSISAQPSAPSPATSPAPESTPGGFTQLFKGSAPPARPTPVSPKPAGELTQMISGSGLTSKPPSSSPGNAPQAGATRLFSGESSAPAMAPLPSGPSEYTRVVSSRQLRDLQAIPAASNSAAPGSSSQVQGGGIPPVPGWPTMPPPPPMPLSATPPLPQLATPPMPHGMPPWQPPQVQVQQPPPYVFQPPQAPNIPTAVPPAPALVAPKAESKILTYLPIIIGLNVLFLIAVLLILLFALKR